jgi:hypothetical protein
VGGLEGGPRWQPTDKGGDLRRAGGAGATLATGGRGRGFGQHQFTGAMEAEQLDASMNGARVRVSS